MKVVNPTGNVGCAMDREAGSYKSTDEQVYKDNVRSYNPNGGNVTLAAPGSFSYLRWSPKSAISVRRWTLRYGIV